ncbi:MAG: efflux RND transporter permease subunit [Spirochaetes bacterium]|nr:efflux RND transporter permease subunit [Spirochaetota bacterium]
MRYFLVNKISAFMLCAAVALIGAISCGRLPVSLMPRVQSPGISVIIEYPGVSPDAIERIITKPVEKIVKMVEGIESIDSVSEEGKSRINIAFTLDSDIRLAALKVRERISLVRRGFPREVQEPVVVRYDPSDRPVLIATIEKRGASMAAMRETADRTLKPTLQRIDGVSEIFIAGGAVREIHVNVHRDRFEARELSFGSVASVIRDGNISLPGGTMESGGREYLVNASSRFRSPGEIAATAVMTAGQGSVVRLGEIAAVDYGFREAEDISRLDGAERITIYVHRSADANTLSVCRQAAAAILRDPSLHGRILYNQGDSISRAVRTVAEASVWGTLIVILVLALFVRRTVPVVAIGISIPFALLSVFALMYFGKIDLNVMSLSGLALGVGMVVDNGIIIAESVFREKTITDDTVHASVLSVRNAIVASTLATVIVFLPIAFGDPETRRTYGDLAFTVSAALLSSLFVAIVLVPVILAAAGDRKMIFPTIHLGAALERCKRRIITALHSILLAIDRGEARFMAWYDAALDYSFAHRGRILGYTAGAVILAVVLSLFLKSEVVDPAAGREFYLYLEYPTGTTLADTDRSVKKAEAYLKRLGIAETVTTKVEKWRGTAAVTFRDDITSLREQRRIKGRIRVELNKLIGPDGAFAYIAEADEIASRELDIHFLGNENEVLRNLARNAAGRIQKIPGIEECVLRFREGRPEYTLSVDRARAAATGVSASEVIEFFRSALYGPVITKFIDKDREVDVRVRYDRPFRDTIERVLSYTIRSASGSAIPVSGLVTMKENEAQTRVWRRNGRRSVTITAKIGTLAYDEAAGRIQEALASVQFPPEYTFELDRSLQRMRKDRRAMMEAVALAILLVYMLLASQFQSLRLPLVILTTVPMALIGVVLVLFVTASTLNISVYIGIITLTGIVVNNGILLVDALNQRYLQGTVTSTTLEREIKEICFSRVRPVVITKITTILGMVPMMLSGGDGSNLWRPLAITVTGGLAVATLLTLVVIPVLCIYLFHHTLKEKNNEWANALSYP